MLSVRSGKGLGDAIYLYAIARHLVARGEQLEVCTLWPDVFRALADRIRLSPWRRERIDAIAHYIARKRIQGTDQFVDCCINMGITEPVAFRLDWTPVNKLLVAKLRTVRKPIVIVQLPREPMGRSDGFGLDLLPDGAALQRAVDAIGSRAFKVQVGKGKPLFRLEGLDLDLANQTSVTDLLDVASIAAGALGYCSFIVPLAEALNKPALLVWSRRGLRSREEFIRQITPGKVLHRPASRAVMDDCSDQEMGQAADAFCHAIGSR